MQRGDWLRVFSVCREVIATVPLAQPSAHTVSSLLTLSALGTASLSKPPAATQPGAGPRVPGCAPLTSQAACGLGVRPGAVSPRSAQQQDGAAVPSAAATWWRRGCCTACEPKHFQFVPVGEERELHNRDPGESTAGSDLARLRASLTPQLQDGTLKGALPVRHEGR